MGPIFFHFHYIFELRRKVPIFYPNFKIERPLRLLMACLVSLIFSCVPMQAPLQTTARASADIWISAYYGGWTQGCGTGARPSPRDIDYEALTHVFHFAVVPRPDGSVDYSKKCISPENSASLTETAHAAGRKVLISVGGEMSEPGFLGATNDKNLSKFVNNLVSFMTSRGYDGIDIDWEPVSQSSYAQYRTFVRALRMALGNVSPRPMLTAAVKNYPILMKDLQNDFDQINVMTYCLSGPWPGWKTWHNAPLYDAGYRFDNSGAPLPSADGLIDKYVAAGVDRRRLGIGIAFFGYEWTGGSGTSTGGAALPGQSWTTPPSTEEIPYHKIMDDYYQKRYYRWDAGAKAAYLSVDTDGAGRDKFISYDDETACREKIRYIREKEIGGAIIFELGDGWRPKASVPDALLKSIKDAVRNSSEPQSPKKGRDINE